ncbi:MAG: hypothetical protein QMC80_01635 [Thermoplasmatales archaeon]|nr:hypothetical protein [Thermoplasmatales archaeon]
MSKGCKELKKIVDEHLRSAALAYEAGNRQLYQRHLNEAERIYNRIAKMCPTIATTLETDLKILKYKKEIIEK